MWIKVHDYDGKEMWIQTQNICGVFSDQRTGRYGSIIQFPGTEENYILCIETVDEVGAMIKE